MEWKFWNQIDSPSPCRRLIYNILDSKREGYLLVVVEEDRWSSCLNFPGLSIFLSPLYSTLHHSCLSQILLETLLMWTCEGRVCGRSPSQKTGCLSRLSFNEKQVLLGVNEPFPYWKILLFQSLWRWRWGKQVSRNLAKLREESDNISTEQSVGNSGVPHSNHMTSRVWKCL